METLPIFMNQKTHHSKMSVLLKSIYSFCAIPIKVLARIFVHIDKYTLKFILKSGRRGFILKSEDRDCIKAIDQFEEKPSLGGQCGGTFRTMVMLAI